MLKKILYLLSNNEKKKLFLLLSLFVIMAFFDLLGITSIAPFVNLLSNPEVIETNPIIFKFFNFSKEYFSIRDKDQFLSFFGIIVAVLFLTSIFLRSISIYAMTKFSMMREYSIGKKLIEGYLHQDYKWFLNRNSADLGKVVLSEVQQVIDLAFIPLLQFISQTLVASVLLTLLIIYNPILSISVGLILSSSYFFVFFFLKNYLLKIGNERLKANEMRFHSVSEAFGAIKEIKLNNTEDLYVNFFSRNAKVFSKNKALAVIIGSIPRFMIEALAFSILILSIIFFISTGSKFTDMLPTIAVYSFAGYRLMPTFQQIYAASTKIRFSRPALDALYNDVIKLNHFKLRKNKTFEDNIIFNKSISFENLNFKYPDAKKNALDDINISIKSFSKVGIVGSTGSGKTTLVDIILCLLNPDKGNLLIDGIKIQSNNKRSWQKLLGYVPQQIYLSDSSINNNIAFGINNEDIDYEKIKRVAKISNLHNFIINKLPNGYDTVIGERGIKLSGGERQRIGIARALYHDPKVIIFDEATSSLDNITEKAVLKSINELKNKITIIMIAHRLATVKKCDQIYLINNGKLASKGNYEELLNKSAEFQEMISSQ